MANEQLYRISFTQDGEIYEIYSRLIEESHLFGFIEISDIVFGETSTLVVDPSEERLRMEFKDISSIHVPMHNINRIDQVKRSGVAKIKAGNDNVAQFPKAIYKKPSTE